MPPQDTTPYLNRELSWLAFNGRVLQEAANPEVPLLERLKFLAIFSSNLDEFFRVRVASQRTLVRLRKKKRGSLDFNPAKLLKKIHRVVQIQQQEFGEIFTGQILPALEQHGIRVYAKGYLGLPDRMEFSDFYESSVRPLLNPVILNGKRHDYHLENRSIYLVVELWPASDLEFVPYEPDYGLVEIPADEVGRFVTGGDNGTTAVAFLDDVIRMNLADLFPGYEVNEAYSVKMTRDAELYLEDEFSGDLVEMIAKSLSKRESGLPTRFLFDPRMPYPMVSALKRVFLLEDDDLVPGGIYHNFSDFFSFPNLGRSTLLYSDWEAVAHPAFVKRENMFASIREKDRLLHVPYQSFDPVVDFLEEAADDPNTKDVFVTLYRVAPDSRVCQALIRAAENGKNVAAFVEVKARFDEEPNIRWGRKMENSGVHVLYSRPGIKVHAKVALVRRVESDGSVLDLAYLSTGNFNEKTARVYSDLGLFTADKRLTADVRALFEHLDTETEQQFNHLLVAPGGLRLGWERLIEREIEHARAGKPAGIVAKLNSLEDPGMVDLLCRASQIGVNVRLVVRGICCLKPGIDGVSDNIRITSVIDRYLEHSRIFRFENGGAPETYLASADWMRRNLNRRVEVAFPIFDQDVRAEINDLLDLQLQDNVKARLIDAKQTNTFVDNEGPTVRAQESTFKRYRDRTNLP